MGNTILAHALYACNKIDVDLKNLFSKTGNAHKISGVNCTDLYAAHLVEVPVENPNCVIEVKCNDWSELLRIKFSYSKWYQDEPKLSNFEKFFTYRPKDNSDELWQQFYTTFKDPSWPDCETFEQLIFLPDHIQSEILSVYTPPNRVIVSDTDLAEYLTQCYYDHLAKQMFRTKKNFAGSKILLLQDYINGDTNILQQVCEVTLGWCWENTRSSEFYQAMIKTNQQYFDWLDKIKAAFQQTVDNTTVDAELAIWEQSLIIAKICHDYKYNPQNINWNDIDCNTKKNNLCLDNFKRTYQIDLVIH